MTDKKTLYILLPVAAVIWGVILYQIISGLSPDVPRKRHTLKATDGDVIKMDSVDKELLLNYRDPFYSVNEEIYKPRLTETGIVKKQSTQDKKQPSAKLDQYQIRYFGVMQNPKTQKKMALVILNGAYHYVEKGTEIDFFKIIQITPDSIGISVENRISYIHKRK